jgi:enoyl-CoA hydratase/carnithine racemase
MSKSEAVRVQTQDGIAVVTLNRPEKLNGLDFRMFDGLIDAAKGLAKDTSVRAVILRGEGRAFCAGLDFAAVGKQPHRMLLGFVSLPGRKTNLFQEVCWAWRELPMPVIAALHGFCYGGGIQIALAADFRIAAPDCELSVMEARWGLVPDMSGSVALAELLPLDVAKKLTMTGEVFDGTRALELGLVTELAEDPLAAAEEFARTLAARSPDAVAATKRLLNAAYHQSVAQQFGLERELQIKLIRGKNHKIARAASRAKEPPVFAERKLF